MILTFIFLIIAGFAAGLLASVAGLASLVSYPALLAVGLPPVLANVTNTTALIFSGIGATASSMKELRGHWKKLTLYVILSLIGSIGGSILLLVAPASSFEKVVPFFILFAGILLFMSGRKKRYLHFQAQAGPPDTLKTFLGIIDQLNRDCPRWCLYRLFWGSWWRHLSGHSFSHHR